MPTQPRRREREAAITRCGAQLPRRPRSLARSGTHLRRRRGPHRPGLRGRRLKPFGRQRPSSGPAASRPRPPWSCQTYGQRQRGLQERRRHKWREPRQQAVRRRRRKRRQAGGWARGEIERRSDGKRATTKAKRGPRAYLVVSVALIVVIIILRDEQEGWAYTLESRWRRGTTR